ncbi:putative serine/threonine-protein kinase PBL6 [Heracleum sosnowskyi]|uniref:Serine/threonine-protein kinase PBL6 n=1 Tax=Heracleum sosnowskyi TaxID=360622 RepID=A0AAD8J5J6_9APIA|nr:putative serine/threonine-protein kinase PBL6 [Heracleum sosnowskyi]
MSMEAQSVVVIQDASSEVCWEAIRWILQGLSLKTGDMVTLLSLLTPVHNPSSRAYMGTRKLVAGYISREDSPMLGANHETVQDIIARKMEEYQNSIEHIRITKLYHMQKVLFNIMVLDAGPSAKVVALEAARQLSATWVILDRKIKKDQRYFLEKLSCGISRMKRYNNVEKLRGPKGTEIRRNLSAIRCSYDEMLPGPDECDDLFSIELFPIDLSSSEGSTKSTTSSFGGDMSTAYFDLGENGRIATEANVNYLDNTITCNNSTEESIRCLKTKDMSDNSLCSICKMRRPSVSLECEYSYAMLIDATSGFSPSNLISAGDHGAVYRGTLLNEVNIAIKEQKYASFQWEKKYESEVEVIKNIRHNNVVMLLGSCSEDNKRFLIFEYVCNGSLNQHIADQSCRPMTWKERLKIVLGASRGLSCLHRNNIIHRDIRPKNILLTHDHEPLLGGFGLARTEHKSDHSCNHQVIDTCGYLAPEYAESGHLTTKADVYAFGVVLLELATGRSSREKIVEKRNLLEWARPLIKERQYAELIDPRIVGPSEAYQFLLMMRLTEKCLCEDPQKRLSMDEVVLTLEHIMEENTRSEAKKLYDLPSIISKTKEPKECAERVKFKFPAESSNNTNQSSNNNSSVSTATVSAGRRSNANSSSSPYKRNSFIGFFKNGPQIHYDEMLN